MRVEPLTKSFSSKSITMQSTAPALGDQPAEPVVVATAGRSGWHSDGVVYALAGLFGGLIVLTAGLWYEVEIAGLMAAIVAVCAGLGLHVLKVVLHAPKAPPQPRQEEITFTGKFTNADDGTIHIDQINDPLIKPRKLIAFCRLIEAGNFAWVGRPKARVKCNMSRSQHERIRAQFEANGWFNERGEINGRGRLMVRFIAGQKP